MARMTWVQLCGVATIMIGGALIGYSMDKANEAKGSIEKFTNFFSHNPKVWNPLITFFGSEAQQQASQYDTTLTVLLYSGIALVVIGLWGLFFFRKRT